METKELNLKEIAVPPTLEETAELKELQESIKDRGLLNPITVHTLNGEQFQIIAGRRRYWACANLGLLTIPARILTGSEQELKLATIEENLRRENLPWYDIIKLVAAWHQERQGQHGVSIAKRGKADRANPGWSMRDTAEELKLSLGFVSEAVMLDREVERNPSLRNIKDRSTAVRLVKSQAKRMEAEANAEAPAEFAVNEVYNGSSVEILKQFPPGSFDACITDPPWLTYMDDKLTRDDETVPVFKEVYRVLRPDSFLYLFVGFEDYRSYTKILPTFGFSVSKTPLIWVKHSIRENRLHGVVLSKGARAWEYSRDFELIVLAVKGSPALVAPTQLSSVLVHPPLPPVTLSHPNEKPTSLIVDILDQCTHQGAIILDPFAGSGAHIKAAQESKRRYVGIERNRDFYEAIVERMKKSEGKNDKGK